MLSVAPKYLKDFLPMALKDGYPTPLGELYEAENVGLTYNEVLDKCSKVFEDLLITDAQCKLVEQKTKGQASSRMWYTYRCGRITASKFGAVIKSSDNQPPESLVKAICYPESAKFTTAATRWGIQQETKAKEAYIETMSSKHLNFDVTPPPLDSTFLRSTLILAHHLMGRCLVTVVALCAWRSNVPTWQKTRHC